MVSTYKACPRKFLHEFCLRKSGEAISPHLHAGGAIAEALAVIRTAYFSGLHDKTESLVLGLKALAQYYGTYDPPEHIENKSFSRCATAVICYFDYYGWETDTCKPMLDTKGRPLVEYTMSIPLPVNHPETGEPIIYGGRTDFLGSYYDQPTIVDDKTSSSLGAQWAGQWTLRGQFLGYAYMSTAHGIPISTCIVRGMGLLKTEIKYQQAIVHTPRQLQERWYEELIHTVIRMTVDYENRSFGYSFADACASYGGCSFLDVCTSSHPQDVLETYATREWDPLHKDPTHTRELLAAAAEAA